MGRLFRIVIYTIIIFVLYLWLNVVVRKYIALDNKENAAAKDSISVMEDSTVLDVAIVDTALQNGSLITNEEIVDGKIDYQDVDETIKQIEKENINKAKQEKEISKRESVKPTKEVRKPIKNIDNSSTTYTGATNGKYMVMAGSYLLKENAEKMRNNLLRLGYKNAKIIVFDQSQYHSIVAIRHESEGEAELSKTDLISKGIDCFIKIQ